MGNSESSERNEQLESCNSLDTIVNCMNSEAVKSMSPSHTLDNDFSSKSSFSDLEEAGFVSSPELTDAEKDICTSHLAETVERDFVCDYVFTSNVMHPTMHSTTLGGRKRSSSQGSEDAFGWFEDFDSPYLNRYNSDKELDQPLKRSLSLPTPLSETPLYVLESSLPSQRLWYETAGKRPKQPEKDR